MRNDKCYVVNVEVMQKKMQIEIRLCILKFDISKNHIDDTKQMSDYQERCFYATYRFNEI